MAREQSPREGFRTASTMTARAARIQARAEKAVERLGARHEANQAAQVAKRFEKLMRSDRPTPTLKPHGMVEDRRGWLMRSAHYQIKREHASRIVRVKRVAERMIDRANGKDKNRDGLAR